MISHAMTLPDHEATSIHVEPGVHAIAARRHRPRRAASLAIGANVTCPVVCEEHSPRLPGRHRIIDRAPPRRPFFEGQFRYMPVGENRRNIEPFTCPQK